MLGLPYKFKEIPESLADLMIVGAVLGLIVWAVYEFRHVVGSKPTKAGQNPPIPVADALGVIVDHFKRAWGQERVRGNQMVVAANLFREAAADGKIVVRGRREINRDSPIGERFSSIWQDLPSEFWKSHELDLPVVLDKSPHFQSCETQPELATHGHRATPPGYAGLRVRPQAVRGIWPAPKLWRREGGQRKMLAGFLMAAGIALFVTGLVIYSEPFDGSVEQPPPPTESAKENAPAETQAKGAWSGSRFIYDSPQSVLTKAVTPEADGEFYRFRVPNVLPNAFVQFKVEYDGGIAKALIVPHENQEVGWDSVTRKTQTGVRIADDSTTVLKVHVPQNSDMTVVRVYALWWERPKATRKPQTPAKAGELEAYFKLGRNIEEALLPAVKRADGTIKSLAANLDQRGAEETLGFLDQLRREAASAFDAVSKDFEQTQRYGSLTQTRDEYALSRDAWWTAFNKVVSDVRSLPANVNRQQIEQYTGADARSWDAANNAAFAWASNFITSLKEAK